MLSRTLWYLGERQKVAKALHKALKMPLEVPGNTEMAGRGVAHLRKMMEAKKLGPDPRRGAARQGAATLEGLLQRA